jgi:ArsR family transcriptional regulator, virulence genes transcriptional regulator
VEFNFDTDEAAKLLSLAGNEARLQVLELICEQEWDVGSLAKEINLSQSALSQHLKKLRDGKLVTTRRDAQTVYYSCRSAAVTALLATLQEIYGDQSVKASALSA